MGEQRAPGGAFVVCGNCRIPVRVPDTVRRVVFPDDIRALQDIMSGEFNSVAHFCGERVAFPADVLMVWPHRKWAVLVGDAVDRPEPGTRAITVADYEDLGRVLGFWLATDARTFTESLNDRSFFELDRAAKLALLTPARLLTLVLELEGRREAQSAQEFERFEKIYTVLVADHLGMLAADAASTSDLHRLHSLMVVSVPARCLTPAVLAALCAKCDDDVLGSGTLDRSRIAPGYRAEFTCAVVHALAGVPNPRQRHWALLLVVLWDLSQDERLWIDDRFFLDAAALQATLPFDVLCPIAMGYALPERIKGIEPLREFSSAFGGLMERAGYGRMFHDQIQLNITRVIVAGHTTDDHTEVFGLARTAAQEDGVGLGTAAAAFADRWTRAFPDQTVDLVTYFTAEVYRTASLVEACRYATATTTWLNRRNEWRLSWLVLSDLLDLIGDADPGLSASERVDLWNEIGNTARYAAQGQDALDAYDEAEAACAELPDSSRERRIIAANRAIVLRDHGRLQEAEQLLLTLAADHPDDPQILHSLVVFYDRVGDFARKAAVLDSALALPALEMADAAKFLHSRAELHRRQGLDDEALIVLRRCWRLVGEEAVDFRLRLAGTGVQCHPHQPELVGFRAELISYAFDHTDNATVYMSGAMSALGSIAEEALERGDTVTARRALEFVVPAPRAPATCEVTQAAIDWAWLLASEGDRDTATAWLKEGLRRLDQGLPTADDAAFALSWVGRTREMIDRLLELATQLTAEPADLVAAYEMANGRELTAADADDLGPDLLGALTSAAERARCDVVLFLDGTAHLTVLVVSASGTAPVTLTVSLTAVDISDAVSGLAAFDRANPVAPHRIDGKLADWWRVSGIIADAIRPHLTRHAELVILPGRRLAATPLHLAGWPDAPLIDDRPVSVCPNVRVLLTGHRPEPGPVGVVAVPKATDTGAFRAGLRTAADDIARTADKATVLADADADEAAVIELAGTAAELVFLCHGVTSSGPGQGPGICVSAGGHLPPSPLPVDRDAALAQFVLSWDDLTGLPRSPSTVVSMACSTGRSLVGPGGTRLGLEQGFLPRGGDTIISPLWNIDQESSLVWLRSFYSRHTPGADDVGEAHRYACAQTRRQYPHPFAWGPFLLTRRLPKDRDDHE